MVSSVWQLLLQWEVSVLGDAMEIYQYYCIQCKVKVKLKWRDNFVRLRSQWVFLQLYMLNIQIHILVLIQPTFKHVVQRCLTVVIWPYVNPYALLSVPDGAKTLFVFCFLGGCTCCGRLYLLYLTVCVRWHRFDQAMTWMSFTVSKPLQKL